MLKALLALDGQYLIAILLLGLPATLTGNAYIVIGVLSSLALMALLANLLHFALANKREQRSESPAERLSPLDNSQLATGDLVLTADGYYGIVTGGGPTCRVVVLGNGLEEILSEEESMSLRRVPIRRGDVDWSVAVPANFREMYEGRLPSQQHGPLVCGSPTADDEEDEDIDYGGIAGVDDWRDNEED